MKTLAEYTGVHPVEEAVLKSNDKMLDSIKYGDAASCETGLKHCTRLLKKMYDDLFDESGTCRWDSLKKRLQSEIVLLPLYHNAILKICSSCPDIGRDGSCKQAVFYVRSVLETASFCLAKSMQNQEWWKKGTAYVKKEMPEMAKWGVSLAEMLACAPESGQWKEMKPVK